MVQECEPAGGRGGLGKVTAMDLKRLLIVVFALTALAAAPGSVEGAGESCEAPPELVRDDPGLSQTAQRLKDKQPIVIVVIGGSSTVGGAAGGGDAAYPHQLEIALAHRFPGVSITVLNRGVARETADKMAARLERDALQSKPTLVVWEVGVTDAVRATDLDAFATTLQGGIAELRDRGIDVMLMDMQYSPDTTSVINFQPYLDELHQIGDLAGVYVFHRYDIMKYWSDAGVFQFTDVPKAERSQLATKVYACLGERLADAVVHGAR